MSTPVSNSGAGARPTTSGTIDNIGAGEHLGAGTTNEGPAPQERMRDKRTAGEATAESPTPDHPKKQGAERDAEGEVFTGGAMAGPGPAGTGADGGVPPGKVGADADDGTAAQQAESLAKAAEYRRPD